MNMILYHSNITKSSSYFYHKLVSTENLCFSIELSFHLIDLRVLLIYSYACFIYSDRISSIYSLCYSTNLSSSSLKVSCEFNTSSINFFIYKGIYKPFSPFTILSILFTICSEFPILLLNPFISKILDVKLIDELLSFFFSKFPIFFIYFKHYLSLFYFYKRLDKCELLD